MKLTQTLAASLIAVSLSAVADDPMTVNVSRISMDVANKIAMATITSCRAEGIPVSVSVVDRNGIIQAQLRDTVAPPVSLEISYKAKHPDEYWGQLSSTGDVVAGCRQYPWMPAEISEYESFLD